MKKSLLFLLAGLWLVFMIFERAHNTVVGINAGKKPLFFRLTFLFVKILKSSILFSLLIFNVFMAISLIGDKKIEES